MFKVRKSHERGYFDHGWLTTFHTFSFGEYFDRYNMHFRNLRVINEDRVAPGHGFEMHPHKDMEIITYIISGSLEHKDSMGNGAIIRPGEIQYMSAGSGVMHSEKNPSPDEECHLLQIWILPDQKGLEPRYDQRHFRHGPIVRLIASESNSELKSQDDPIKIRADVNIYAGAMSAEHTQEINLSKGFGWVQVVSGNVSVTSVSSLANSGGPANLSDGDGLSISEETSIRLTVSADRPATILVFDLP